MEGASLVKGSLELCFIRDGAGSGCSLFNVLKLKSQSITKLVYLPLIFVVALDKVAGVESRRLFLLALSGDLRDLGHAC